MIKNTILKAIQIIHLIKKLKTINSKKLHFNFQTLVFGWFSKSDEVTAVKTYNKLNLMHKLKKCKMVRILTFILLN